MTSPQTDSPTRRPRVRTAVRLAAAAAGVLVPLGALALPAATASSAAPVTVAPVAPVAPDAHGPIASPDGQSWT